MNNQVIYERLVNKANLAQLKRLIPPLAEKIKAGDLLQLCLNESPIRSFYWLLNRLTEIQKFDIPHNAQWCNYNENSEDHEVV